MLVSLPPPSHSFAVSRQRLTPPLRTPSLHLQAEDRTHRIGATRDVEIVYIVADGSYDQDMYHILLHKSGVNDEIMDCDSFKLDFSPAPKRARLG